MDNNLKILTICLLLSLIALMSGCASGASGSRYDQKKAAYSKFMEKGAADLTYHEFEKVSPN